MSSSGWRAAAVVVLVAAIAIGRAVPAHAGEPDFIAWIAPEGCPDAAHVRADVGRLGGVPRADARATVIVVSRGARYVASIAIDERGTTRTREVEGATCREVADAAALVLAIAFRSSPDAPAPPALASSSAATTPRVSPSPAESPASLRARPSFAAGVGAAAFAGVLPSASAGAGAWLGFLPGRWRFELAGYVSMSQSASLAASPIGADFRLFAGSARTCANLLASTRFALAPCAGIEAMRITAIGFGMSTSHSTDETRAAGSFGALATWSIERAFALRLAIDGVVPVARPRFVVEGEDGAAISLHRPAALGGRMLLGAEIRF